MAGGVAPRSGDQGTGTRGMAAATGVVSPPGAIERSVTGEAMTAEQKIQVILGTATPGGGFPLYGDAVTAVINEIDPSLSVEPRNTKGSTENIPLLEAGKLDIALVTGEPAYEAFAGIGRPRTELKILAGILESASISPAR